MNTYSQFNQHERDEWRRHEQAQERRHKNTIRKWWTVGKITLLTLTAAGLIRYCDQTDLKMAYQNRDGDKATEIIYEALKKKEDADVKIIIENVKKGTPASIEVAKKVIKEEEDMFRKLGITTDISWLEKKYSLLKAYENDIERALKGKFRKPHKNYREYLQLVHQLHMNNAQRQAIDIMHNLVAELKTSGGMFNKNYLGNDRAMWEAVMQVALIINDLQTQQVLKHIHDSQPR